MVTYVESTAMRLLRRVAPTVLTLVLVALLPQVVHAQTYQFPWGMTDKRTISTGYHNDAISSHDSYWEDRFALDFNLPGSDDYFTSVRSIASGVVIESGCTFDEEGLRTIGYGCSVVVEHANEILSKYSHLELKTPVKRGTIVCPASHVGRVGNTGRSTGPHLHFQMFETVDEERVPLLPEPLRGRPGTKQTYTGACAAQSGFAAQQWWWNCIASLPCEEVCIPNNPC